LSPRFISIQYLSYERQAADSSFEGLMGAFLESLLSKKTHYLRTVNKKLKE
jgi:hypothetical protein